jgi:hypothetical protein
VGDDVTIEHHPFDDLVEAWGQAEAALKNPDTPAPALEVTEVTDDGETWTALRCPRCGSIVDPYELIAVDMSIRWNRSDDIGDEDFVRETISFAGSDHDDYGDTLFYMHNEHTVSLPDGWKESWL